MLQKRKAACTLHHQALIHAIIESPWSGKRFMSPQQPELVQCCNSFSDRRKNVSWQSICLLSACSRVSLQVPIMLCCKSGRPPALHA